MKNVLAIIVLVANVSCVELSKPHYSVIRDATDKTLPPPDTEGGLAYCSKLADDAETLAFQQEAAGWVLIATATGMLTAGAAMAAAGADDSAGYNIVTAALPPIGAGLGTAGYFAFSSAGDSKRLAAASTRGANAESSRKAMLLCNEALAAWHENRGAALDDAADAYRDELGRGRSTGAGGATGGSGQGGDSAEGTTSSTASTSSAGGGSP